MGLNVKVRQVIARLLLFKLNYCKRSDTNPFVFMLDASKTVDHVNYVKLFRLLFKRDICLFVLRCLLYMCTNQNMNVVWNNTMSDRLTAQNGVEQGGVLSPLLFAVYIDELFKLKRSGCGCTVGHVYCDAYGEVFFPASTKSHGLKQIYTTCHEYARSSIYDYNPAKFQLVTSTTNASIGLVLEGTRIDSTTTGL